MRLGLFSVDAGTRIVVEPTEPSKFVANVSVHLLLAQNEETIFVVVRDECQDVVEVISCCLCLDLPRVPLVEPLHVDQKVLLQHGADDHQVSQRRRVLHRELDLISALAKLRRDSRQGGRMGSMRRSSLFGVLWPFRHTRSLHHPTTFAHSTAVHRPPRAVATPRASTSMNMAMISGTIITTMANLV